jgi:Bifunctional DNA primase/polymerase, N-terminal
MTDNPALRQALAYARRGWPVFPCLEGQKVPATRHGYKDATTDPEQITGWFGRDPVLNGAEDSHGFGVFAAFIVPTGDGGEMAWSAAAPRR